MTNLIPRIFICLLTFLMLVVLAQNAIAVQPEFCWKDTTTRGVGTIPTACPSGTEKVGEICYENCPKGKKRSGVDCHTVCPSGMRSDGLHCRKEKASYGRGVGWSVRKNCEKKYDRCEQDRKKGSWYAKCRDGYTKKLLTCYANKPDCKALGMGARVFGYSCEKKIEVGKIRKKGCSGKQLDAGLCYKKCPAGSKGVGPVCWGQTPKGWVACGMGSAKDSVTCAKVSGDQVFATGNLALNVASFGTSGAATSAATSSEKASRLEKLRKQFDEMRAAYEKAKALHSKIQTAEDAYKKSQEGGPLIEVKGSSNNVTEEDMIRMAAQIAAIIDTSGVAATVAAYTYPKCSKYFGK